jgi:hypothetical protein
LSEVENTVQIRGDQAGKPSLRELAHAREMDFLSVAEKSQHAEIRKYALGAAKAERKHMHRQEARVSSSAALTVSCVAMVLAILFCLYVFFSYPLLLAEELGGIATVGAILLSVLCFVFSDKLEASAAVELFRDVLDRFKPKKEQMKTTPSSSSNTAPHVIFGKSDEE